MNLDGPGWTVREALGETWRWYVASLGDKPTVSVDKPLDAWHNNVADAARHGQSAPGWWPASVPGSVVTDLWRAGELPDPYHARNSRAAEWTGSRSWVYRRDVELPSTVDGERVVLEFDGVDPSGTVFWDGVELGRMSGLYRRARFEVPAAGAGRHRLAVVVDPVPASQPQVGRTDLVRTHRPRMNEGWDFCPRLPHQGIWRGVRLVLGAAQLTSVSVSTDLTADDDGTVTLTATLDGAGPATVGLDVLDAAGRVVARRRGTVPAGDVRVGVRVPRPDLWWPNGYGEPSTYTARVHVDGRPAWRGTIGFRRATLVRNVEGALPYTAVVNGAVMPLVGWNWVPADAQYGAVTAGRVRHLVDLAARSGARMLRVWGGGLVETEEFYDACDRAGLLVWQEFSQSSSGMRSAPSTDPGFVRLMADEAAHVVPARTHHPSLFVWGGGNELDSGGIPLDEERSPVLATLRDAVRRLDPGRAWLPTSPSGPSFHFRPSEPAERHDVHGPWEHQGLRDHYRLANSGDCLAHTEFGVEGMTNTLDGLLPPGDRWPADRTNPAYRHLGDWWVNTPLVQRSFGHRLSTVDELIRASQLLQATGLAYSVEADRRRFPHCSIVLPWQLNESYPNAFCTSCVDHHGRPKPAYHAVSRAFAARRVTVRVPTAVWAGESHLTAQAWVWDEHGTGPGSRVSARLRAADGEVLGADTWTVDAPVRHPRAVGDLTVDAAAVPTGAAVVWDLTWEADDGTPLDREVVLACTGEDFAPLLDLAPATVRVTTTTLTHHGGPMVVGLRTDSRPLMPGESRPVDGPVDAWNLEIVT